MHPSDRLETVPASPIRKLFPYAQAAKSKGVKIYHLNIGDPDIKTPEVMLNILKKWNTNPIGYDQSQGNVKFIEALLKYYHKLGAKFLDTPHIQVTSGGSEAISMALFATCSPGDEVIVFEPFYANYNTYASVNGVKLVPLLTTAKTGFHLPTQKYIEAEITKKTRAILYCNPNNPTGTVYTWKEIEMLVSIAKKHHLFLLSDEVYREFCYDGKKQMSILDFMEQIPQQAILLDSMSKRYSLCGARLGTLVSLNQDVMAGCLRIAQGRLSAGLIDQAVAQQLTLIPAKYFKEVHDEYQKRRNVLFAGLSNIPGVVIPKPEGAFYAIVGLPVTDSEDFCKWLLTDFREANETVMLAPAAGFYGSTPLTTGATKGKNEVRIAYVLNTKALKRCIALLKSALETYPGRTTSTHI